MPTKIIYWIATGLLALMYLGGAAFYITQGEMVRGMLGGLGYPAYLVTVLIVVKILGAAAVLVRRPVWLSDLAYAGMFFHLLLAVSAHVNAGDGGFVPALVGLVALLVSFFTQNAVRKGVSPYAGTRFGSA
jgi:uncharacterized membrane protein YhaH (DUF805 family)